jgi:protein-L-isoaspartate(D-aspartate) O-methyltransferase
MDHQELRENMVKTQLIPRGIIDERVLSAMKKVPRHLFVDESMQHRAYDDCALSIGEGQTISQPYMVAVMTELLELKGDEKVLEIGAGSGYQAAILAELSKSVYTVERVHTLAAHTEERLRSLGYTNVHIKVADGTLGWQKESPFDRIIVTAGSPKIPPPLLEQLSDDGIIIAPIGDRFSQQLQKLRKSHGKLIEEFHTPCVFVPLIGEHGWKGDDQDNRQFSY